MTTKIIILFTLLIIFFIAIILYITKSRIKNNYKRIFTITLFIILSAPTVTYTIAYFFKHFNSIEQVGSVDSWISFAGSIIGSSITMIALILTLRHEDMLHKIEYNNSIKPFLYCNILNMKTGDTCIEKLDIKKYINNYDFIKCKIKNVSNNIATNIKLKGTKTYYYDSEKDKYIEVFDLLDNFGIQILTFEPSHGITLAPNEYYIWKNNIGVFLDDNDNYLIDYNPFCFKYDIFFEYTDIYEKSVYTHHFEFVININQTINGDLSFFVEDVSNSLL